MELGILYFVLMSPLLIESLKIRQEQYSKDSINAYMKKTNKPLFLFFIYLFILGNIPIGWNIKYPNAAIWDKVDIEPIFGKDFLGGKYILYIRYEPPRVNPDIDEEIQEDIERSYFTVFYRVLHYPNIGYGIHRIEEHRFDLSNIVYSQQ